MELLLNKTKYEVKENINDISLAQFKAYNALIKSYTEQEVDDDFIIKLISIFSNIPEDLLLEVRYSDLMKVYNLIKDSIVIGYVQEITPSFTIDKVKYSLIDFEEIKTSEFIDLETFIKKGLDDNIESIIAIMYSNPKVPTKKRIDIFKEKLTIGQVYSALLFFWISVADC